MGFVKYKIGDISTVSAGGDRPPICSDKKTKETTVPIFSNGIENEGLYGYTNQAKIEGDTVTVSARGVNIGTVCYRPESFMPIVRLLSLVPNREIVNAKYLHYYLKNTHISGTGSAQPQVTVPMISNVEIVIHKDLNEQKKIADLLSTFDNKIKANNQINRNLQNQADAIFNEMFFAETHDKWHEGSLSELITVKYGKDHKKLEDGTIPCYGSGGVMRYVERPLYDRESVLIPRKGSLNNVMYVNEPFWSVDTMFFTEMNIPNVAKFVFHFVKEKDLASMNAGSAVPSMTTEILYALKLRIPDVETLKEFEENVTPLYKTIKKNVMENKKLAEIRDVLLPKLMSGVLDVSDIDI